MIDYFDKSADKVLAFDTCQLQGADGVLNGYRWPLKIAESGEEKDLRTYQPAWMMRWDQALHS